MRGKEREGEGGSVNTSLFQLCSSLRELSGQALHNLAKRDIPCMKENGSHSSAQPLSLK